MTNNDELRIIARNVDDLKMRSKLLADADSRQWAIEQAIIIHKNRSSSVEMILADAERLLKW